MANLPLDINHQSIRLFRDESLSRTTPLLSSFQPTITRTPLSNCQPKKLLLQHTLPLQKASTLQKRYQIERERALIDLELRRLELEEQKSRCMFDELHLDNKPRTDTPSARTISTTRIGYPPLGKLLATSPISKRAWDSSTNTMDMSLSSSSSSSSDDEELKLRQLQAKQHRRNDSILIKEIVVEYSKSLDKGEEDDNNSVTSLLTLPLAPWEELEKLITSEQHRALETAQAIGPPERLELPNYKPKSNSLSPRLSSMKHSNGQREKHGHRSRQHRPHSHHRPPSTTARQGSFRNNLDEGDEHPGRVKNMPIKIEFPKDYIDSNYYFSPQWLHSSPSVHATYTGPLRQGLPYGIAIVRFENGDMYMGEVVWGEMHGQGTYRTRRGQVWRGLFARNVFVGSDGSATLPSEKTK